MIALMCVITFPTVMKQVTTYGEESDYASAEVEHTTHDEQENRVTFAVMSDVQMKDNDDDDISKLERALDMVNKYAPKQDAIAVVGDLTNNGREKQYNRFMTTFLEKKQQEAVSLLAIGNHDYWNNLSARNSHKRFKDKTGMKNIFYHHVINGYHFIVLGTESGTTHGLYSIPQIKWLKRQLKMAERDNPTQPIFVFLHQHVKGTVYGSDEWGTSTNHTFLYKALAQHPQVVTFSGHSHYPLSSPKSIHQRDFTSIGLSSVNYMEVEEGMTQGSFPTGHTDVSQGIVVEANGDNVKIKRIDFLAGKTIGKPWVIRKPSKVTTFSYTDNRDKVKPIFRNDAKVSIDEGKSSKKSLEITFDQALDNECVHAYRIKVIDQETNEVVSEKQMFSEFYKTPMPVKLDAKIEGLEKGKTYRIEITAIDSFLNESEAPLIVQGTTK
ncbi:metallophosphoesterase family protein [Priestia taiwanensis]|nr:metallophosphoesterase [Priestia taiwanensis]MBM7363305.1 putative MPP superfamily phosphohydrolase [Priestia taiwanensis]